MNYDNVRYLHIDSAYRDRTEWPNPAEFHLVVNNESKSRIQSTDSVSNQAIVSSWQLNRFELTNPSTTVTGSVLAINSNNVGASGDNQYTIFIKPTTGTSVQEEVNYYKKAVMVNTNTGEANRISYSMWRHEYLELRFDIPFRNLASGDTIAINDPTDIMGSYIFVPNSSDDTRLYTEFIVNETLSVAGGQPVYIPIDSFHIDSGVVKHSTSGLLNNNDVLSVRKELPRIYGFATNNVGSSNIVSLPTGYNYPEGENLMLNDFIIIRENGTSLPTQHKVNYSMSATGLTGTALSTTQVPLLLGSTRDDIYNNLYVLINGEYRLISDYDGTTRVATLSTPLSILPPPATTWSIHCVRIFGVGYSIDNTKYVEHIKWNRDNEVSLNIPNEYIYNNVLSRITLVNLTIPNTEFRGVHIREFPFLLLEIRNVDKESYKIQSNNKSTIRCIFKIPIDSLSMDKDSGIKFLHLKSNMSEQIMNIDYTRPLLVRLLTPDGYVLDMTNQYRSGYKVSSFDPYTEYYSPSVPNIYMQFSFILQVQHIK